MLMMLIYANSLCTDVCVYKGYANTVFFFLLDSKIFLAVVLSGFL